MKTCTKLESPLAGQNVMSSLKTEPGSVKLPALNRERLIEFGRKRAKQGAGPATLAIDLSFIRTIITHAAAVHGIEVSAGEARLARVALRHLNLVGRGKERDRRPTQDELDELIEYFETNPRQFIPMGRIVRYAVATTLRQEEICKPEWPRSGTRGSSRTDNRCREAWARCNRNR